MSRASANPVRDADDPRIADFRHLNDASHRRRIEAPGPFHRGHFVVEGWLPLERLLQSRYEPRAVLVADDRFERAADLVAGRSVPIYLAPRPVLDEIVGFPLHRGVVATADRANPVFAESVIARSRRLVILESINDAENLGAILRSARALGADGILLDATCADPLSRRSVRVSVGHVLALAMARFSWIEHTEALRRHGVLVCAMSPGEPTDLWPETFGEGAGGGAERGSSIAAVLGAEGPGLSEAAFATADLRLRIPMDPAVDSLNVAAAAAIAFDRLFRPGERNDSS